MPSKVNQEQLELARTAGWGGQRKGAGRKNLTGAVNHMARTKVDPRNPMHITLRLKRGMPSLRRKSFLGAFAQAAQASRAYGLKINHFSILGNHLHLIAEAKNNRGLSRGMQGLSIRLAKAIVRIAKVEQRIKIQGAIFWGRYHLRKVTSPIQMKNVIRYVLTNEFRHRKQKPSLTVFSSGGHFNEWHRLGVKVLLKERKWYQSFWNDFFPLTKIISLPESWLGHSGWRLAV